MHHDVNPQSQRSKNRDSKHPTHLDGGIFTMKPFAQPFVQSSDPCLTSEEQACLIVHWCSPSISGMADTKTQPQRQEWLC